MSNPIITASFYFLFLYLQNSWRKCARRWERPHAGTEYGGLKLRNLHALELFGVTGFGEESSWMPAQVPLDYSIPLGLSASVRCRSKALVVMENREMWGSPHKPDMSGRQEKSLGLARWHGAPIKEKEFRLLARANIPYSLHWWAAHLPLERHESSLFWNTTARK